MTSTPTLEEIAATLQNHAVIAETLAAWQPPSTPEGRTAHAGNTRRLRGGVRRRGFLPARGVVCSRTDGAAVRA